MRKAFLAVVFVVGLVGSMLAGCDGGRGHRMGHGHHEVGRPPMHRPGGPVRPGPSRAVPGHPGKGMPDRR